MDWLHLAELALNGASLIGWRLRGAFAARVSRRSLRAIGVAPDLLHGAFEIVHGADHAVHVVAGQGVAHLANLVLDIRACLRRDPIAHVFEGALGLIGQTVSTVARLDLFTAAAILLSMLLGLTHHAINLILREAAGRGDGHFLLASGRLISRGDVENTIGIDIEGYFDLWHATRGRSDAFETEVAEALVVAGHFALALQDVNFYSGLVIFGGAEGLTLARRDGRIALDEPGHHAAEGLNTQRKRRHVEQEHVLDFALQHTSLNGGTNGHHFVRVDPLVRLLTEDLTHEVDNCRHTSLTTDQDDFIDLIGADLSIGQGLHHRFTRALDEVANQLLQFRAAQSDNQVFGACGIGTDERQVDLRLLRRRKLDLGAFGRLFQTLQGHAVLAEVNALILLEVGDKPVDNALVKVVSAEVGVTIGRLHLKDALAQLQDGDIKGAATQVIDRDGLFTFDLIQTIGQRSSRRLVNDTQNFQAGDLSGVLRGGTLRVVKVGRDSDNSLRNLLAQAGLGVGLQLLQDHGRNFWRAIFASTHDHTHISVGRSCDLVGNTLHSALHLWIIEFTTHQALDRVNGVLRVGHCLTLGNLPHQSLATLGNGDNRRSQRRAFAVIQYGWFAGFHDRDNRVCCSEVDTNHSCHCSIPP